MKTTKKDLHVTIATKGGYDALLHFCTTRKIPIFGGCDYETDYGPYGPEGMYLTFPLRIGGIHEVEEILHAHGGGYVTY